MSEMNGVPVQKPKKPAPTKGTSSLIAPLLEAAVENKASDIHIKPLAPAKLRINGKLANVGKNALSALETSRLILNTMTGEQVVEFKKNKELDYSIQVDGIGRFRVNAYYGKDGIGLVARRVESVAKTLDELAVPPVVKDIAANLNGLILVTGATGSGKSTTLAGMIDLINTNKKVNIVAVEDPIEIVHRDKRASIVQREVGVDTLSFAAALRSSLRQDPDVILIGEMRDIETAKIALTAAETGHLVLSTLHTTSAPDAIDRLIEMFPQEERGQVRYTLSQSLRAIICQRLVPTLDSQAARRVAVMEILVNKGRVTDAILSPESNSMVKIISEGTADGMQLFEDHLFQLVSNNVISKETAMAYSNRQQNLRQKLRSLKEPAFSGR